MHIYAFAGGAGGANTYTTTTTFRALQSSPDPGAGIGYTFLAPGAPGTPHTQLAAHPQIRVSDNGHLAIEDANVTARQPRHLFADPALIPGWNKTLTRLGTHLQIFPEPAATVTFSLPAGAPITLVRVQAANLEQGNAGDRLTITENCDGTVTEVTGAFGDLAPVLGRNIFLGTSTAQQSAFFEYFAAIALTGGYPPNNDLPAPGAALNAAKNAIANQYGDSIRELALGLPVVHNPNLANDLQHLAVNQHARPARIGQGLRTASMGARYAIGAGQGLDDHANNRVIQHPADINQVAWGYHWGGVVAVDGTDYITLENYARAAETSPAVAAAAAATQVHLFYFQMYGAGPGQSWHEQWEPPGPGKAFVNGLTTVVEPVHQTPMQYYVPGSKNTQASIAAAADLTALQRALLNGLNYANMHLHAPGLTDRIADKARLQGWQQAVAQLLAAPPAFAAGPQITALALHVANSLAQVTTTPV